MSVENLICDLCKKPLLEESWIDDEQYGDVHVRCLDAKEQGFDSVEDMESDGD